MDLMKELNDEIERHFIVKQSIIGLCSIAIQHIMDENYDKAENTVRGIIVSLEGQQEA